MKYIVRGGKKLNGKIDVYGAKNCVLALLGACLLTDEKVTLTNCPHIVDVYNMLDIMKHIGCKVTFVGDVITVKPNILTNDLTYTNVKMLRGSLLFMGSLLSMSGKVTIPLPGGCNIGERPIDIHIEMLQKLGAIVNISGDIVTLCGNVTGAECFLRLPSVGATENLLCASVVAKGNTILRNCAVEPEVVALCNMLVQMGAKIDGIGTATLSITGVKKLHGTEFRVIPDRIVASTYLFATLATKGNIIVNNVDRNIFNGVSDIVKQHCDITFLNNKCAEISYRECRNGFGFVETKPYPCFPTDLQSMLLSTACLTNGTTIVKENMFENRLMHNVSELQKMGGDVICKKNVAVINGSKLHGAKITGKDLRGGAGLVIASLGANGVSEIFGIEHINRGYVNLADELKTLGADITFVDC